MENEQESFPQEEGYVPRPKWQVWGARIGIVVILILLAMYYINIARGGL